MRTAIEHQVAVDFVGNHNHTVGLADAPHLGEDFAAPLDAHGVVGIAENHHAGMLLAAEALKLLKIHMIGAGGLVEHQRVGDHTPAVALHHATEGMVHRGLDNDAVALAGEIIHGKTESLHHPGHIGEFLAGHTEAMTAPQPVDDRFPVAVGGHGIAVDGMGEPAHQRVGDLAAHCEIHVGNPQRLQVGGAEQLLQFTPFGASGAVPVYYSVKIIHSYCSMCCPWFQYLNDEPPRNSRSSDVGGMDFSPIGRK